MRAIDGPWSWEWTPVSGDNYGVQAPHGRYVVRLEVPGSDPQERVVTISGKVADADFDVP